MQMKTYAAAAGAALVLLPAGLATGSQGNGHGNGSGPKAGATDDASSRADAYGKLCQGASKKHVKGSKGTPFSQCVAAMAKLDSGEAKTAKSACKSLSKKHVKGMKGTPYSTCIKAAAKLRAAS